MGNIRPPKFGVKKDEITLTTQDPVSVVYGVTPDDKWIPLRIDNSGRLELAAGVTLEASDFQIGAVEIKNHDSDVRSAVTPDNELVVESRVHDGSGTDLTSTLVGAKQGLDVNVIGGSALSISEDEDGDVPADKASVGLLIGLNYGYDGTSWRRINATSNALHVDVKSSVLPTGAATETTLSSIKTQTDLLTFDGSNRLAIQDQPSFDVLLSSRASEATLSTLLTESEFQARINTLGQKTSTNSTPVVLASDQSTVSTDPTDSVAREVGRVLASHNLYVSESYATTDSLTNARPINGDFDVQHYKTKNVVVKNVDGVNDAEIEILGSVDGTNLDVVIVPIFTLKPGEVSTTSEERAFTNIRVNARSKVAGNSADIETKAYGLGV